MPGDINLQVRIKADGSGLVGEVTRVERSLDRVGKKGGQAGQQIHRGLRRTPPAAYAAGQAIDRLQRRILALVAAGQAIRTLNGAVEAAIDFQRVEAALKSATGSTERAREEFVFLEREAERLGFRLRESAIHYAQLAAATRGTALEGQSTREVFLGAAEAATALGLSVTDTAGILRALTQIVSKGNVSAEELRGQFGERVAGAFELAAQSMGATTSELNRMLARGEVLAVDLLPKLGRALRERFGQDAVAAAQDARAQFNRFHNDLDILRRDFAESGFLDGLLEATSALRQTFADPEFRAGLNAFGKNLGDVLRYVVEHHEAIVTGLSALAGLKLGIGVGKHFGPVGTVVSGAVGAVGAAYSASQLFSEQRTMASLRTEYQSLGADITRFRHQLSYLNPDRYVEIGGRAVWNADSSTHEQVSGALAKATRERRTLLSQLHQRLLEEAGGAGPLQMRAVSQLEPVAQAVSTNPAPPPTLYDQLGKNGEAIFQRRQAAVREGLTSLLPVYEQATQRAALWRDEQLENLNRAAAGYDQFAAEVHVAYSGLLAQAHQEEQARIEQNIAAEVTAAERIRAARESQFQTVRDALITTLPVYDQAVARARIWRDEQLAAVDIVGAGFQDYAEDVAAVYRTTLARAHEEELERIERERVARLAAARDWRSGAERSLAEYTDSATNLAQNVEGAFTRGFGEMEDALTEFVRHGKVSFSSLADSILNDLARIYVRSQITGPLAQSLGLSGGSGGGGGLLGRLFGQFFGGGNFAQQFGVDDLLGGLFAEGGVMTSHGPSELRRYAQGGIAHRPQLALFGEGSQPEAYVPLPDGRTIPVTLKAALAGGTGPASIVNHYHQYRIQVDVPRDGEDIEGRIERGVERAVRASVHAVAQRADRGGTFARQVGRR